MAFLVYYSDIFKEIKEQIFARSTCPMETLPAVNAKKTFIYCYPRHMNILCMFIVMRAFKGCGWLHQYHHGTISSMLSRSIFTQHIRKWRDSLIFSRLMIIAFKFTHIKEPVIWFAVQSSRLNFISVKLAWYRLTF